MRFCFTVTCSWILAMPVVFGAGLDARRQFTSVVRPDPRNGRLVRAVVVKRTKSAQAPSLVSAGPAGLDVGRIVEDAARRHQVDPLLVHAMIEVESGYNPYAVSSKGAEGLMQLIPATARRFGAKNGFNLTENIAAGVRYLRHLLDLFQDERLALAAYNAGEEAVIRHRGIPPYRETRNYVALVSKKYGVARQPAGRTQPAEEPGNEEAYQPVREFVDGDGRLHIRTY